MHNQFDVLRKAIQNALRSWHKLSKNGAGLLEELQLVQTILKDMIEVTPTARRLATNEVLRKGVDILSKQDEQASKILIRRFMDKDMTKQVALQFDLSEDQVKRSQRDAIIQLTHIIMGQELQHREALAQQIEGLLPPSTYATLFGVDNAIETLEAELLKQGTPYILAIIGIGGIGKTSLADAVVRRVIRHFVFDQVIWLTIQAPIEWQENYYENAAKESLMAQLAQRLFPYHNHIEGETSEERASRVRQALKQTPYLVVVDNLEAEGDTAALLASLSDLANPSKFLLTTRTRPGTPTGLFNYPMPELNSQAAATLIRHHAQHLGANELAKATDNDIEQIYSLTGGNPLALKLVIGLAAVIPLPQILTGLVKVELEAIEQLYLYIYQQVWATLSENSRALLEIMPLASGIGMTPEDMQVASGLTGQQLWPAIIELVNRSLLEIRGTAQERRYAIHRLTETFLRTEIIKWSGGSL